MNQASATPPVRFIRFGLFEADLHAGELRKNGLKIKLQDQPFRVLSLLLERPGEVVTREEFREKLWSADTFVDFDHGLNAAIKKVRHALADSAENPRFVETVARRGYRFIAPVQGVTADFIPEQSVLEARNSEGSASQGLPFDNTRAEQRPRKSQRRMPRLIWWIGALAAVTLLTAPAWLNLRRSDAPSGLAPMEVLRFTSYPGIEKDPALSPDGKQIAFVWDGEKRDNFDVYVQLISRGSPIGLTSDPRPDVSPAWSPDGAQIAFARLSEGDSTIYLIPSLGGRERKLAEMYSVWSEGKALDWSPDGKLLVVAGKSSREDPYGLFLISVESGKKQKLTTAPLQIGGDVHPSFSPDGQTVAFSRVAAHSVYLVPVAGGQPRPLTPGDNSWGSAWTSDGREIINFSASGDTRRLRRVPVSGGKPGSMETITQGRNPSISRGGNRIAYVEQTYDTDIWRIEVPDSQPRPSPPTKLIYSSQPDDNPQFSPDGRRIVFASNRSGNYESWVCDSDGRNPFRLVSSAEISGTGSARWSPDGRDIAFDHWVKGPSIFVVSPESGSPRRLESADGYMPSWSKDRRWIYFCSNRTGEFQIWKVPAEGGKASQVSKNGGFEALEAPDGKALYYSKINKAEAKAGLAQLWKMSLQSGEEHPAFDQDVYTRYWAMTDRGIFFVPSDWSQRPAIEFFSFATGQVTQVAPLEKPPAAYGNPGLTVSPDGKWILCALVEQDTSDIMLVENFR